MTISPGIVANIPRLTELLAILFSQEAEFTPDAHRQRKGLRLIMEAPHEGVVLVAREDGTIWGMAVLLFTVSTFLGAKVAVLEDVIVDPARRGQGIGSRLIAAAVERAILEGCARITLLTDGANVKAKAFYRREGFTESTMVSMRLLLPQDQ